MEPATHVVRLRRRATVFKLTAYAADIGLRINPEAILRKMAGMGEGLASSHTRSEVWQLLRELRQVVDGARPATP